MISPTTPRVNFLVKSKAETKPLSKAIQCLFILIHIVFALDFGFLELKSRKTKIIVKLCSLTQMTIVVGFLFYTLVLINPDSSSFWYCLDVFVYYLLGILLLFITKYTYRDFQRDLHSFDGEINVNSDCYKIQYVTIIGVISVVLYQVVACICYDIVYIEFYYFPGYFKCTYFGAMAGKDFVLFIYGLVFHSIYLRLKKFTSYVNNDNANVVSCHYLYKNIVEITERTKKSFDLILVVALLYVTIDVILTIYQPFTEDTTLPGYTLHLPLAYVLVLQELVMTFMPAVSAGLVSAQTNCLKLVLYNRLVRDQKHTRDLKRFIRYIEARPLRFRVWMVIPLDWTLPVIVGNISITYLIVMIQFTLKNGNSLEGTTLAP